MSLTEVGLVLGVMSSLTGALGGTIGGFSVRELGRKRAFFVLNLMGAFWSWGYISLIMTRAAPGRTLLYAAVGAVFFLASL